MIVLAPLLPSILSVFTKAASVVSPTIVSTGTKLLELAVTHLPKVVKTVEAVSQIAGILMPSETANELGAKAMHAEKKPEHFEKYNDYIDYLRNEVVVDMSKLSQQETDIAARQVIGSSVLIESLREELGCDISIPLVSALSKTTFEAKAIIETIKLYSQSDINSDDFQGYMDGELDIDELDLHSDVLVKAQLKADPNLTLESAEEAVIRISKTEFNI